MRIRKARKEDYRKIANLRRRTFENINAKNYLKKKRETINKKNPPKIILDKMKKREMFCLVDNNKILGVIDLEGNKVGGFFVRHNSIGKGFGDKLLNFIENHAKKKGIKKVKLSATRYAYSFYIKRGYRFIRKRKDDRWDNIAYELEKKL